jgi:hypothetical protein
MCEINYPHKEDYMRLVLPSFILFPSENVVFKGVLATENEVIVVGYDGLIEVKHRVEALSGAYTLLWPIAASMVSGLYISLSLTIEKEIYAGGSVDLHCDGGGQISVNRSVYEQLARIENEDAEWIVSTESQLKLIKSQYYKSYNTTLFSDYEMIDTY